ncbi:MAG: sigma-54-dependent Fis family transcriptional regulator [Armatimonadetes bacterium]|nr:sigma-54-dependent Fis family transcriptional regulator [Armatimonadota bacterium]
MSKNSKLLIVDDELNIRRILQMAFEKMGNQVLVAEDARVALQLLESNNFDLVITDVTMPGMTGYELQNIIHENQPDLPVIIMTAYGTIPQAVAAIRNGAYEYVTKPFDLDQLKKIVVSALGGGETLKKTVKKASKPGLGGDPFLAASPAMQQVLETVRQVADSKATVMIGGESGVGKEVVANALHTLSSRSKKPFVAVSCAALPETLLESELFGYEKGAFTGANGSKVGRFEAANEGTLFLDEIGEIPHLVQVKLLRVLQEREIERLGSTKPTKIDVRLITATHRDLRAAVDAGSFRLDLLYRLQVVEILIPPLRERIEDIVPLAELFMAKFAAENGRDPLHFGPEAVKALHAYPWPGNVRELENTIERAMVLAPAASNELETRLLPERIQKAA